MKVLVTGSSGFIASALIPEIREAGHEVMSESEWPPFDADAFVHLGALIDANHSKSEPWLYARQNAQATVDLLSLPHRIGSHFIFASSCVAAHPESSPYAATKRFIEDMLPWMAKAGGFTFTILRLFNVAGAHRGHGENHQPETHLIPRMNTAALAGEVFTLNCAQGSSGPIRDYVHLSDVVAAIMLALATRAEGLYEVGTGVGSSLIDVARCAPASLRMKYGEAREEPFCLVSDPKRWLSGWEPKHDLKDCVVSDYEQRRNQ